MKKVKVVINGQEKEVEGEQIKFIPFAEPFCEYHLDNGSIVRIKTILLRAVRAGERNPDGTPVYQLTPQVIMTVDESEI